MKSPTHHRGSNRSTNFRPAFKSNPGTTPRTAQDTALLSGKTPNEQARSIAISRTTPRRIPITFEVYEHQGPALKAAIDEASSAVGTRLEGKYEFPIEQALTDAAGALGTLRAAITAAGFSFGDPSYRSRK